MYHTPHGAQLATSCSESPFAFCPVRRTPPRSKRTCRLIIEMRVSAWTVHCISREFDGPNQLRAVRGLAQRILERPDALVALEQSLICRGSIELFREFANGAEDATMCDLIRGPRKLTCGDLYADDRDGDDDHIDDGSDSDDQEGDDAHIDSDNDDRSN